MQVKIVDRRAGEDDEVCSALMASLVTAAMDSLAPDAADDQFQSRCWRDVVDADYYDYTAVLESLTAALSELKDTMTQSQQNELYDNVKKNLEAELPDTKIENIVVLGEAEGLKEYTGAVKEGWFLRFWIILMWFRRLFSWF